MCSGQASMYYCPLPVGEEEATTRVCWLNVVVCSGGCNVVNCVHSTSWQTAHINADADCSGGWLIWFPQPFFIVTASRKVAVDHAQVEIFTRHFPLVFSPLAYPLHRSVRGLGTKLGSFLASWHCRALTCSYRWARSKEVFQDTLDYCSWFCMLLPWTQLNELMSIIICSLRLLLDRLLS